MKEFHTESRVHFVLTVPDLETIDVTKKFKLEARVQTSNLVLFDASGKLRKYGDLNEILREFYTYRLALYSD